MATKKLYEARVIKRIDELDSDTNDRPCESVLYIMVMPDDGCICTESYYICDSLKAAYQSFFNAINQASTDGSIPNSVASIWAEPMSTTLVTNAEGIPYGLADQNGNLIFSDTSDGNTCYFDVINGRRVWYFISCTKIK